LRELEQEYEFLLTIQRGDTWVRQTYVIAE
jgi:hypothetical protein